MGIHQEVALAPLDGFVGIIAAPYTKSTKALITANQIIADMLDRERSV